MIIRETATKDVEVIKDIRCDACGKSCWGGMNFEYALLRARWGYDSRKDDTTYEARFCENCFDDIEAFVKSKGGNIPSKEWILW